MSPLLHRPGILEQALQPGLDLSWSVAQTYGGRVPTYEGTNTWDDDFSTDLSDYTLTQLDGNTGTVTGTVSGGRATLARASGSPLYYWIAPQAVPGPAAAVEIEIFGWNNAGGFNNLLFGFFKDDENYLSGEVRLTNSVYRIVRTVPGSVTNLYDASGPTVAAGMKLSFSIVRNAAMIMIDKGSGWEIAASYEATDDSHFLPLSEDRANWKFGFGISSNTAGNNIVVENFKGGAWGHLGRRDPTLVTYEDGTPYDAVSGKLYFSVTRSGNKASAEESACWGLIEFDTATQEIQNVAAYLFDLGDGPIPLTPGHIVRDRGEGNWKIFVSGFGGDSYDGVGGRSDGIRLFETSDNILTGNHILSSPAALSLPLNGEVYAYDPFVWRKGNKWLMAYTVSDTPPASPGTYYPALARSSDLSTWTAVAFDPVRDTAEGTRRAMYNGLGYIFSTDQGDDVHVYDEALRYLSTMEDVQVQPANTSPAHFMLFDIGGDPHVLTFDGTRWETGQAHTWGSLLLLEPAA